MSNTETIVNTVDKIKLITPTPKIPIPLTKPAELPATLKPVIKNGKKIETTAWIMGLCNKNHIHKYYKINLNNGKIKDCLTCLSGSVFMKNTRILVEECLGAPMILDVDGSDRRYWNPIYKIQLIYPRIHKENDVVNEGGFIKIILMHKSITNAIKTICAGLRHITSLTIEQHMAIDNLSKLILKSPLMLNEDLNNVLYGSATPLIALDDYLCIENCKTHII